MKRKAEIYNGFEPRQDRVLVKPADMINKTAGGIIIPDSQQEKPNYGEIVGLAELSDPSLKLGDKVLYGQYSGFEVKIGTEELRLIRSDDAYARVK